MITNIQYNRDRKRKKARYSKETVIYNLMGNTIFVPRIESTIYIHKSSIEYICNSHHNKICNSLEKHRKQSYLKVRSRDQYSPNNTVRDKA